ncbi:hypothetical protein PPL_10719 [Heterostelium album PN500]|uniref:Uncharacterized protein n=1 Tax=Heterostelium pallidum (strain ATCC 26659 / Pp 5 / PN500) TaxID=670386 RepID=D3BRV6_HETP5|nr:hypothetical protein PPL_10719 [Heterostelium album PN500]EFA76138.1 hypothetical protein PPL_10719 [Heterostelium album PN500]|eukprot:XP_020428272.1 hypothetical protein PPL_10719 [Heterostelium album PN500]
MNEDSYRNLLANYNQFYGKSKILFDVFVSDPIPVNTFIYKSWLDGLTERECASRRDAIDKMSSNSTTGSWQLLLEETEDQYRNFSLLQTALEHPKTLANHSMFQMDLISRRLLIEGYYEFDDYLMRELIGRKLTSGQRRDLDDTSEKLKIRLSTCERQFDNLKRISRVVFTDVKSNSIDLITNEFSLSRDLAKKYARVLFLCFHRFDLSHKRVNVLNTQELMRAAEQVMSYWGDPMKLYCMDLDIKLKEDVRDLKVYLSKETDRYWRLIKSRYQSTSSSSSSTATTVVPPLTTNTSTGNLNVNQSPRVLTGNSSQQLMMNQSSNTVPTPPLTSVSTTNSATPIATSTSTSANNIMNSIAPNLPPIFSSQQQITMTTASSSTPANISINNFAQIIALLNNEKLKAMDSKFKSLLKGILAIGSNLSDSKEFRNLFEDIIEKIIDPLKRMDLTRDETDTFFMFMVEVFSPEALILLSLSHKDRVVQNWKSFIEGIREIVKYIYEIV